MTFTPPLVRSVVRIALLGAVASALVGVAGRSLERARLGATDAEALARLRSHLTERFDGVARELSARAEHVAAAGDAIRAARRSTDQASHLFELLDRELPDETEAT